MRSPVQRGSGTGAGSDSQNHWYAHFYSLMTCFKYGIVLESVASGKLKTRKEEFFKFQVGFLYIKLWAKNIFIFVLFSKYCPWD